MRSRAGAGLIAKEEIVGAPSAAEARKLRTIINRHQRPDGVLTWNAGYGDDWTGEPAIHIWFHVRDEDVISDEKIDELTFLKRSVREDLLNAKLGRWPFVGFRNPPA